jgi:FkbM family methyltransferase
VFSAAAVPSRAQTRSNALKPLIRLVRPVLVRTLLRPGSVRTIQWGPSRGLRYHIFPEWGFSPIYGGWEPDAQRLMVKHLKAGDVAYDLGANHGIHSLLLARLVGPRGHVYAFEPLPELLQALVDNVALNGFTNVTPVPCAVASRTERRQFYVGHSDAVGHLAGVGDVQGQDLEVATITLDDFVLRDGHQAPTFLKIDIEGAEGEALEGSARVLEQFHPTILADLHNPRQDALVGNLLADLGYVAYRTQDMTRVKRMRSGWPDPEGMSGQFIAFAMP